MSAKYFFRTIDENDDFVSFDIDRIVAVAAEKEQPEHGRTIVTLEVGREYVRQIIQAHAKDVLAAIEKHSVRP